MKTSRFIFTLTMALVIALGAVASRMPDRAAATLLSVTICSGDGTKTILVEPENEPNSASHICLECCLVANELSESPVVLSALWQAKWVFTPIVAQNPTHLRLVLKPGARAPPTFDLIP